MNACFTVCNATWNSTEKSQENFLWITTLSDEGYLAIGSYLIIIGCIALIGNNIVLLVFCRQRLYRRPVNLFILNLAMSDLVVALLGHPMSAISAFKQRCDEKWHQHSKMNVTRKILFDELPLSEPKQLWTNLNPHLNNLQRCPKKFSILGSTPFQIWIFGYSGCQVYAFICYLCGCNGIMTHAAISYFRYVVMCKFRFVSKVSLKHVLIILVTIWLYSLFWTLTPLIGWSAYEVEPYNVSCSLKWYSHSIADASYIVSVFIFVFIVPMTIVGYSYIKIVNQARRLSLERLRTLSMPGDIRSMFILNLERKVTWVCFLMTLTFLVTWLPYAIISLVFAFGYSFESPVIILPTMFAKSSCAYNPFIFCFTHEKFRDSVLKIFCNKKNKVDIVDEGNKNLLWSTGKQEATVSYHRRMGAMNIFTASSFQDGTDCQCSQKYIIPEDVVRIHMEPRAPVVAHARVTTDFSRF